MSKIIWLDTETTGLDPQKAAIIELATEDFNLKINPYTYSREVEISKEALEINGFKKKQMKKFPDSQKQFKKLIQYLDKRVNKFDPTDKLIIAGYNSRFDTEFLREWFKDNGNDFYGSYFYNYDNDVFGFVKKLWVRGELPGIENLKLKTVCDYFNIKLDAHKAADDIAATIELSKILDKRFLK